MAKIIAIANQKGGVGKTTTTMSLGVGLSKLGKKVLLADFDSQANLTMYLGIDPEKIEITITSLLSDIINKTEIEKNKYLIKTDTVDLIASDITLSGFENKIINEFGREKLLGKALRHYQNDYDYILIDCMPSLNILTINALTVADSVLIPVQTHFLSIKGLEMLLETIINVQESLNEGLRIEGILFTMFDVRTSIGKQLIETVKSNYQQAIKVFDTVIPSSVKAIESTAVGKSIFDHDKNGKISEAYKLFTEEVVCNG